VRVESELALARLQADQLMGAFTKNIAITGKLDGNFNFVAEGPTLEQVFQAPNVKGKFKLVEGSVSNVDLVAVMQSDAAGQRAGVTKFNEVSGEFSAGDQRSSYRQVNLLGGVLRGNGSFDVGANGSLAGRASLEIRSQVAQDRGAFNISGTVQRPSSSGAADYRPAPAAAVCCGCSRSSASWRRIAAASRSRSSPSPSPRRWCSPMGQGLKVVIDEGFARGDPGMFDATLGAMVGLVALFGLVTWIRVYNVYWIGARFTADLRQRVYDHLLTLSPAFYEDVRTGKWARASPTT
jgi:hypothetical protein